MDTLEQRRVAYIDDMEAFVVRPGEIRLGFPGPYIVTPGEFEWLVELELERPISSRRDVQDFVQAARNNLSAQVLRPSHY